MRKYLKFLTRYFTVQLQTVIFVLFVFCVLLNNDILMIAKS